MDGWGGGQWFLESISRSWGWGVGWGVARRGGRGDGGFRVRFHRVILLQPHLSSPPTPAAHAASTTTTCAVTSIRRQKAFSVTPC